MFEAFEMIMNRLESIGDVSVSIWDDEIFVTLEDFEGFDAEYSEIARDYKDQEMVDALIELLESCETVEDDWCEYYLIENHKIHLDYASEDI